MAAVETAAIDHAAAFWLSATGSFLLDSSLIRGMPV